MAIFQRHSRRFSRGAPRFRFAEAAQLTLRTFAQAPIHSQMSKKQRILQFVGSNISPDYPEALR